MAVEIVPWLLALDGGAKVVLDGETAVPHDVLSDWARPVEGLRPIDNDPTSWVLRIARRDYNGEKWTLIGFYDSGEEFSNKRPHAFLGAGIVARGGLVDGMVLRVLQIMIAAWKTAIDKGGKDVEKTAGRVWSNKVVSQGIASLQNTSSPDPMEGGLQPGRSVHFFFVSPDDAPRVEGFLQDLQTGGALLCETVILSSSDQLEQQALDRGYKVRPAADLAAWRSESDTRGADREVVIEDGLSSDNASGPSEGLAFLGDSGKRMDPGAAPDPISHGEPTDVEPQVLHLGRALAYMEGRAADIADEASALVSALRRLNKEVRKADYEALRERQPLLWRRHLPSLLVGALIGALIAVIASQYFTRQEAAIGPMTGSAAEDIQLGQSPTALETPLPPADDAAMLVRQYYELLEGPDPAQALMLRGIAADSQAGLKIVERRREFERYVAETTSQTGSGPWTVTTRISASEAGRQITGMATFEVVRRPPPSPTRWYIRTVTEESGIALR